MAFDTHPLQTETLGDFLKKIRLSSGWQLKDIERKIKIKEEYLKALEEDDYGKFSSPTYVRGFLKSYVEFLNLNSDQIIERYHQESQFFEVKEKILKEQGLTRSALPGFKNFIKSKKIRIFNFQKVSLIIIAAAFLFYFIWLIGQFVLPPKITIFFPANNFETSDKVIQIRGRVKGDGIVKINDQPVSKFENGIFEETLYLMPGINKIKISVKKKNNSETTIWRKIIAKE
ncbi:MAG: helix-turn-helix domain-containing protein [Patescibacteria group bacterium]